MEGLHYRDIGQRENLAELALELRYTLNSKRISSSKLSKKKDRNKIKQIFQSDNTTKQSDSDFAEKLRKLNDHFMNR